jgi:hypothetical protein
MFDTNQAVDECNASSHINKNNLQQEKTPAFLCPPDLQARVDQVKTDLRFDFGDMTLGQALSRRSGFPALSASEKHRLVKASKSSTEPNKILNDTFTRQKFLSNQLINLENHKLASVDDFKLPSDAPTAKEWNESVRVSGQSEIELENQVTPLNSTGCRAVFEFRDWCDEWRVRTEVDGQNLTPPEQAGERITEMLSFRGATKIAESSAYMAAIRGGYKTFVTGTFSAESRQLIASGDTTIQKEVSRTMDAMSKMYQRGWTRSDGKRVEGIEGTLAYCWVVEVPKNDEGEDNPHVHMLLGWRVDYSDFNEWSQRIESIWGNGYFHLEKIKDSECAGVYLAKAAGYLSKAAGEENSQGKVKGNRYGISACARAPGWENYAIQQLHCMSQLIVDVYDHLTVKYQDKFIERKKLNNALENIPKEKKAIRQKIGKKLAAVRQELNALPVRCNKYQVLIKGKGNFYRFANWALNENDSGTDWLPSKGPELAYKPGNRPEAKDSLYHTRLRENIQSRKLWRRIASPPKWLLNPLEMWHQVKDSYEQSAMNQEVLENEKLEVLSLADEYESYFSGAAFN